MPVLNPVVVVVCGLCASTGLSSTVLRVSCCDAKWDYYYYYYYYL